MRKKLKRVGFGVVTIVVLFAAGGVISIAQTVPSAATGEVVQTLTGRIVWRKAMGIPPHLPGSDAPADDICGAFWVALVVNSGMPESPAGYDNKLKRGNDPFLPDHYVCSYSIRATAERNLLVRVGMGDVFQLPKPAFLPLYYNDPWIDEAGTQQAPPNGSKRAFAQDLKELRMGRVKGTYLKIELRYIPK